MTSEFFDWLDQCPVEWFLIDIGDSTRSYEFIGIDPDDEDDDD